MGLDAVVYRRAASVNGLLTDNPTELSLDDTPALHRRLGNASLIGWIAEEALPLLGEDSVLFSKVLYSGSHSGDSVDLEELDGLEAEIKILRENPAGRSSALENFLNDMSDLISKAREEGTPIVFV
ncbi:MAG TPA: hypothetical protein VFS76_15800 [Pyrinomonadaceae bacterium]|nr:hypothetical protein [Pyrinomonadaceae bacterium]